MKLRHVFLWMMLSVPVLGYTQTSYEPKIADPMLEEWRYAYFPELDGKGVRTMTSVNQTNQYWFGLDSGIASYDGYNWKFYTEKDGLKGGAVQTVFSGSNQTVYAATAHGLYKKENEQWISLFDTEGEENLVFRKIQELKSGVIACGTDEGVIFLKNDEKVLLSTKNRWNRLETIFSDFRFVELPNQVFSKYDFDDFTDIFEVSDGKLWLAYTFTSEEEKGDILSLDENEILEGSITYHNKLSRLFNFKLGHDQQIFKTSQNHIWIINRSNKVPALRYANNKWNKVEYGKQFGDDEYSENILETQDHKIWISGPGNIYSLDSKGDWTKYSSQILNVPQGHMVLHSGNHTELWVIGIQSSVFRVDLSDEKWLTLKGLSYQCEQSDGTSWFLDFDGNVVFNKKDQWKKYTRKYGLIDAPVSLFADSQDKIWAVGSHNGLAAAGYFDGKNWNNLVFDSLSWGIDYRAIMEAKDGSIWLGSSTDRYVNLGQTGGLIQIKNPYSTERIIIRHRPAANGLNHSNAYGLAQTTDGKVCVGGSGLCMYDGNQWNYLEDPNLNDFVNELHNNDENILFVGSRQHGLYIMDGEKTVNYTIQNGLLSNNIISIATGKDQIWLATDKGFSLFNGEGWTNHVFPERLTFSYEGGSIYMNQKNQLWISRSLREWKRRVYTGRPPEKTIRDQFVSYRFIKNNIPPQTEIQAYSATVDKSGNTTIVWSGKHFFNTTNSSDLFFSYQLNDESWSRFSDTNNHTFTGLDDGTYLFKVRAMDTEGNIDATPAIAEFTVAAPVWKQLWFILLILSFVILLTLFQYQIIKKRMILNKLNQSLQIANGELESRNAEVQTQKDSLEVLVKKIDELSKAKVKFFTNITHEFRTPLSLILGPIEKLTNEAPKDTTLQYFYNLIHKNTLRLQKLINQLLEIRRIESGTLELLLEKNDLVSFVDSVKNLFNNQAIDKNIKLSFHSDFNKLTVFFDADKIEKILFNLISNAFKHTPSKGKISIKLLTAEKYLMKDNDLEFVRLVVEDNGTGLDEKIIDKLFERFAVGHNELNDHSENSGIGLSYIKDLIESHKGNIKVESELDKGTAFTVYIPTNLAPESNYEEYAHVSHYDPSLSIDASIMTSESLRMGIGGPTKMIDHHLSVLIVEDNPDMQSFIQSLLSEKYNVLTANNGQEGIEVLDKEYVDIIISDIMMPKVDGIAFCQQVKDTPSTSHIPVILLTALTLEDKRISGYDSGADSYIVKPFNPDLLFSRIENLLHSREVLKQKYAEDLRFKPKDIKVTSYDEDFLEKLSKLIDEHVSDSQFDVSKMREMFSMSHMHFIRKVKQLTGKKPIELLKSYRLARAKQLLEQDKINVSEVGYMVGYDVPNSFTRAFRNEYGVSPTKYVQKQS